MLGKHAWGTAGYRMVRTQVRKLGVYPVLAVVLSARCDPRQGD